MAGRGSSRGRGSSSKSSRATQEEEDQSPEVEESLEESTADESSDRGGSGIERSDDGRMILNLRSLWFRSNEVVRKCTSSTKQKMAGGYTCWSMVSETQKDEWFNIFRQSYYWPPTIEHLVRERWNEVNQRRFKDNMYKIAVRKKDPDYMKGGAYEGLMKLRETPAFQARSKQAKINKRVGVEGGNVEPTHYGGSQSSYERALKAKSKGGKLPTAAEIFLETHTKPGKDGDRLFYKNKDSEIWDAYERGVEANPDKKEDEIWFETVQGYKKGAVYGVGNAQELFYASPPNRRVSSMQKQSYVPGIVSQLQDQLEAQERREAERDEEMRKMKEEIARMQSLFSSCGPNRRPPPPDPRDPFGGGGSRAGVDFQV